MAFPDFSPRVRVVSTIVGLAAAVAATIALYRPFQAIPFAIQDFSDFLPLLHRPSLAQQWNGFVHYYATQGRWNLLAYASLIAKWNVFGSNTSAWEWSRFVEIWLIIFGTYVVLRRFGADRSSAAAGAALFAVAGNAVTAWMRMTMGEPFTLCFLLPAVFVAQGYRTTTRWRRDATLIAGFIAAALLVKEMAVAFVPFILAVACCVDEPRHLAAPRNDERTRWLMASSALASLAVLIPVAYVARVAPPGSFASQYTNRSVSVVQALADLSSAVLPAGATASGLSGRLRAVPNVIFLFVSAVGAALLWSRGPRLGLSRWQVAGWSALALALPVCVVAAYQPWSVFQDFYTFPYILGMSMLLAAAMTAVNTLSPGWPARLVTACCIAMLALSAMRAIPAVGRTIARREVDAAVASYLAGHPTSDSVVVIAHGFSGGHWPGTGPTLGRYAAALHPDARVAPFRDDTTCATPREVMTSNDRIGFTVRYADDCGPYSVATASFQVRYRFLTLRPLAIRADSMRIDVCDRRCTLQRATSAAE